MTVNSEQELLSGLLENKPEAFSQVYHLYVRQLLFITNRISCDKEIAEDIVADSFEKLLTKKLSFESLLNVKSFLFITAHNACLDWLRAKKRHELSHAEIKYLSEEAENQIEKKLIYSEVLEILYNGIKQLPPKYAEIITRSFIHGDSLSEISVAMNLSYKTIQNLKAKAIQQLRATTKCKLKSVLLFFLFS
jgi:RNA polymerase sigma factor (sigma-70 family)